MLKSNIDRAGKLPRPVITVLAAWLLMAFCLGSATIQASGLDWSQSEWNHHLTIDMEGQSFVRIGFSLDGRRVFGVSGRDVFVWDSVTGQKLARFSHERNATRAAFSPDGSRLITTSDYRLARIWDIDTGELSHTFGDEHHSMRPGIEFVAWPPQGPRVAQTGGDWSLSILDAMSAARIAHLGQITTSTTRLVFTSAGDRIVTAEANGKIRVFDIESGKQLLLHERHEDQAQIVVSRDGHRVVSIARDGMEVWDIESGEILRRWDDHGYRSWYSPSFSPDGSSIAVLYRASLDGFRILDIDTGETIAALPGSKSKDLHRQPLRVVFAPDGRSILTTHSQTIRIWYLVGVPVASGSDPMTSDSVEDAALEQAGVNPTRVKEIAVPIADVAQGVGERQDTDEAPAEFFGTHAPKRESRDSVKETDLPAELVALASKGQLTVRALRAWGQLPERFSQMALELRRHDIDLLSADQAAVEALVARAADDPHLAGRLNEIEDLAQLLASYVLSTSVSAGDSTAITEQPKPDLEGLPPEGVPGWILVSTEDRSSQNRDSRQSTHLFSLQSSGATTRYQGRQSGQGYSREVNLAFDFSWDEPPRYALKQETWQGRIQVLDSGSAVEYLSGSAPEADPRSPQYHVHAKYRSGTRPIMDRGSAATGRFAPDNPDATGNPRGEAEIRWPEQGCPGDQFTVEMQVSGWSGRGTVVWTYEYHPNLLRSPVFIDQFVAQQEGSLQSSGHLIPDLEIIRDCTDCPEMVVIPAGSFVMGSHESEYGRHEQEGPQTAITIPQPFAMARTPVTQAQWSALMDSSRFNFPDCPDCPADNVSYHGARQYLRRLSEKTGYEYRLPSAAEWEYACRAGADDRYCGSNQIDDVAWYRCNSDGRTHPVASKAANAFGLHDMSGNVMEWTRDCYTPNYELMPTDGSPLREGSSCTRMVSRGGSWFSPEENVRAAARSGEGMIGENGFRPVRVLAEPDSRSTGVTN